MAEYTQNLQLFRPGTDDNVGVETSLDDAFTKIDTKLADGLKDHKGKTHASLGARMTEELKQQDAIGDRVTKLEKKEYNEVLDNPYYPSIAHRGMVYTAPENTLPAFRWAIENGHWGIETDIQLTSDNKWVCIHDTTVDRTSSGTGAVVGKTLSQLKALDFGSWFAPSYAGTKIPTLEEFLQICKAGQVVPFIELKVLHTDAQIEDLVKILAKWRMTNTVAIIAFSLTNLQKVRYYSDKIALGYLTNTFTQKNVDDAVALGNSFLNPYFTQITAGTMALANAKNLPVYAWTVDKIMDSRRLAALGVSGITTDMLINRRGL